MDAIASLEEAVRRRTSVRLCGSRREEELREDDIDVPMVELALQQLVDNAAKYSAADSPIVITVRQDSAETFVTVENTAHQEWSLPVEDRGRIFERFYRGGGDGIVAGSSPPGTGLGLPSSRRRRAQGISGALLTRRHGAR